MCHPHSVRIEMKRLKSLLDSYEGDMRHRVTMGMSELTYSNWAKQEAKRLKKDCRSCANKSDSTNEQEHGLDPLKLTSSYNSSIAVEITKETFLSHKCKRKSRRQEINEWRLAKRVKPGLFVLNAQVICMVDCQENDGDSPDDDYEFFIGTIVKSVEGYVKIHLTGLGKKDDIWLEQASDHLFLDGGLTDPPPAKGRNQKMMKIMK